MSRPFKHLSFAARSELGLKRKNNEDSFGTFPSIGVWCVADGMGGGDDGEIASAEVIQKVDEYCKANPFPEGRCHSGADVASGVAEAVNAASRWIFERASKKRLSGCGSTFVAAVFDASRPDRAIALHAGDSRLYRIRGRDIKQITKDHSAAELVGAKSDAELNPMFRGMILRAVGIQRDVEIEATQFAVQEGDVVVVCSDGLSKMVPDSKISSIVRKADGDVKLALDGLIDAAYKAGATDNVTVEVVRVGELPPPLEAVDSQAEGEVGDDPETRNTSDGASAPFDSSGGGFDEDGGTVGTAVLGDASTDTPSTSRGSTSRRVKMTYASSNMRNTGTIKPAVIWLTGLAAGMFVGVVVAVVFVAIRGCGPSAPQQDQTPRPLTSVETNAPKVVEVKKTNEVVVVAPPAEAIKTNALESVEPKTPPPQPEIEAKPSPAPEISIDSKPQNSQSQAESDAEVMKSLMKLKEMRRRHESEAKKDAEFTARARKSAERLQEVCRDKEAFRLFRDMVVESGQSFQILDNYANQLIQLKPSDNGFVSKASDLVREVTKFCMSSGAKFTSAKAKARAKKLSDLDPTSAEAYEFASDIIMSAGHKGGGDG